MIQILAPTNLRQSPAIQDFTIILAIIGKYYAKLLLWGLNFAGKGESLISIFFWGGVSVGSK